MIDGALVQYSEHDENYWLVLNSTLEMIIIIIFLIPIGECVFQIRA